MHEVVVENGVAEGEVGGLVWEGVLQPFVSVEVKRRAAGEGRRTTGMPNRSAGSGSQTRTATLQKDFWDGKDE